MPATARPSLQKMFPNHDWSLDDVVKKAFLNQDVNHEAGLRHLKDLQEKYGINIRPV